MKKLSWEQIEEQYQDSQKPQEVTDIVIDSSK